MIDFYAANTGNGQRAAIALEESGLEYRLHRIDLHKGEQRAPDYLKINPTGRIPSIVDHTASAQGDAPFVLTQTLAILLYLADKSGKLQPPAGRERAHMLEWLAFTVTDLAVPLQVAFMLGWKDGNEKAIEQQSRRAHGYLPHFDKRLDGQPYLVADAFSLADIAAFALVSNSDAALIAELPNLQRWQADIATRPAVVRALSKLRA